MAISSESSAPWRDTGAGVYVIAEAGVNHNGDVSLARQLIDVAVASGANAVKFQTFKADKLVSRSAEKAEYQKRAIQADDDSQHAMLKRLELEPHEFADLMAYSAECGIAFLSTPFDEDSADMLESLGVDAFKISSGDLTHHTLLRHVAAKGRPMIMSTGMATLLEVLDAAEVIRAAGNPPVAWLHCVSNYPTAPRDCNLRAMDTLASATGDIVGWSDHTTAGAIGLAAVALGARIIEKHYTLSKAMEGPDHQASLEPDELHQFVEDIRAVEQSLGDGTKTPAESEYAMRVAARRSLVARCDIAAGTRIEADMVAVQRPGSGIAPKYHSLITGRTAAKTISAQSPITWDALAKTR